MDTAQLQTTLNDNGFVCGPVDGIYGPRTHGAVAGYQLACNVGGPDRWLAVDGIDGAHTDLALVTLPAISDHFTCGECRSHGDGSLIVKRQLLDALEHLRASTGHPLPVLDVYRDPAHNAAVGGAVDSMHLYGFAADLPQTLQIPVDWIERLGLFSGIGDKNGIVAHVDLRHLAGSLNRTPDATPATPARWHY